MRFILKLGRKAAYFDVLMSYGTCTLKFIASTDNLLFSYFTKLEMCVTDGTIILITTYNVAKCTFITFFALFRFIKTFFLSFCQARRGKKYPHPLCQFVTITINNFCSHFFFLLFLLSICLCERLLQNCHLMGKKELLNW